MSGEGDSVAWVELDSSRMLGFKWWWGFSGVGVEKGVENVEQAEKV